MILPAREYPTRKRRCTAPPDARPALRAVVGAGDPLALQSVDDPAGPGVPYPEAALHRAHGGLLGGHHEARGLLQKIVVWLLGRLLLAFRLLGDLLDEVGLGAPGGGVLGRGDDPLDLVLRNKGPLNARGPQSRDRLEEHVAHAEQDPGHPRAPGDPAAP